MAEEHQTLADLAFNLEYDGPALRAHEMNVRDLAPALLATASLFQELNRVARPSDPPISVNVRATSEGSFLVELRLFYEATRDLLLSPEVAAGVQLLSLVTDLGTLIDYVKRRAAGALGRVLPTQEPGVVRFEAPDGTTLEIPERILNAHRNMTVRRNLYDVTKPLRRPGVEEVRIRREELSIAIGEDDLPAFEASADEPEREELTRSEREAFLEVVTVAFQRDNKWRFTEGQAPFFATILDVDFLDRVESGERFSKYDILRCILRTVQTRGDDGGLHAEYEVLEVLDHQIGKPPSITQQALPWPPKDDEDDDD